MFPSGPWTVLPDWHLPRLRRRIDAVVLMPRAIVACTVRAGRRHSARDRDAAEDAALDLHDFHAGSRLHPVVPLLVTLDAARNTAARPLMLPGVTPVLEANAATLEPTLRDIASAAAFGPLLASADWQDAPYRPVPSLIEAARMLYARHGVADIRTAHADAHNLGATRAAIAEAVAAAAVTKQPTILFVTGIPGAGKTLCGLDTAFAGQAAFLTGNPSLVHVLREALARDSGLSLRAARQRMEGVIQALPAFRDCYAGGGIPPERVVVIDEAQRCWSAAHARAKTATRPVKLADSEPALLLDIMARRTDGPVILCLVGTGQEIHDGEGGLAGWGEALQTRPAWKVIAAPGATTARGGAAPAAGAAEPCGGRGAASGHAGALPAQRGGAGLGGRGARRRRACGTRAGTGRRALQRHPRPGGVAGALAPRLPRHPPCWPALLLRCAAAAGRGAGRHPAA